MAARADAVFAALSYFVWTASATTLGIEISKFGRKPQQGQGGSEKKVGVV
jgi:hypothetical protein